MLKLLVGPKGSGKTKTLVNLVNGALEVTKGDVVCIERKDSLRFNIKPSARLVSAEEYDIVTADTLYGFIAGVFASNHDVTDLFVDATYRLCGSDAEAMAKVIEKVNTLADKTGANVIMTVSMTVEELPASLKKYM